MVRAPGNMEHVPDKSSERRVSSPIGIPNAKLAALDRKYQKITETSESPTSSHSPVSSPGNYGPLRTLSSSAPNRANNAHITRALHVGQHDSDDSISEILDRLPECSPAFSTVFSELVKIEAERRGNEKDEETHSSHEEQKNSPQTTPTLPRKETKTLRFDLPEEIRPRASSHSYLRRPRKKETPSSTHSTPSLSRKSRPKNGAPNTKLVNLVPKFRFLTETITVSHEDIVKEHELQEKIRNGYHSPKSIFGAVEAKASPTE